MTHAECQQAHTLKRAKKRHPKITITKNGYADLNRQIETGQARFIKKLPSGRYLYITKHKTVPIPSVYDNDTGSIATIITWGHYRRVKRQN
jgi:hypothetical protein